ncbi:MAG TPA: sigma-70 family RNA polymerase sigma factor [Solirubrobacteraceae bacterium]|nr:sigma-70 family RNA polymerase sigma factor [Solirubrobacteraceae bacterium]
MIAQPTVSEADAASFHIVRPRLFGIAYRVLGSASEADDVVQDAWIRWQDTDRSKVRDAAAFLATSTTRLAINVTQSARARRETHIEPWLVDSVDAEADPARAIEQREALELALQTLLGKLSPAERAAYVLREAFDYPYRQISQVLGLSEANARQLAARARRRLCGERRRAVAAPERRALLDAFLAAAQTGDLAALEHLLTAALAAGAGELIPLARPKRESPDRVAA